MIDCTDTPVLVQSNYLTQIVYLYIPIVNLYIEIFLIIFILSSIASSTNSVIGLPSIMAHFLNWVMTLELNLNDIPILGPFFSSLPNTLLFLSCSVYLYINSSRH